MSSTRQYWYCTAQLKGKSHTRCPIRLQDREQNAARKFRDQPVCYKVTLNFSKGFVAFNVSKH